MARADRNMVVAGNGMAATSSVAPAGAAAGPSTHRGSGPPVAATGGHAMLHDSRSTLR